MRSGLHKPLHLTVDIRQGAVIHSFIRGLQILLLASPVNIPPQYKAHLLNRLLDNSLFIP